MRNQDLVAIDISRSTYGTYVAYDIRKLIGLGSSLTILSNMLHTSRLAGTSS